METKNIILELRTQRGMSQNEPTEHIDGLPKVEKLNALVGKWRKSGITSLQKEMIAV